MCAAAAAAAARSTGVSSTDCAMTMSSGTGSCRSSLLREPLEIVRLMRTIAAPAATPPAMSSLGRSTMDVSIVPTRSSIRSESGCRGAAKSGRPDAGAVFAHPNAPCWCLPALSLNAVPVAHWPRQSEPARRVRCATVRRGRWQQMRKTHRRKTSPTGTMRASACTAASRPTSSSRTSSGVQCFLFLLCARPLSLLTSVLFFCGSQADGRADQGL